MEAMDIIKVVEDTVKKLQASRSFAHFRMPEVFFDVKSTRCFGQANLSRWTLHFNLAIAGRIGDDFKDTVLHEIAHLMVHYIHKGRNKQNHGPEFREMCAMIGCSGSTYVQNEIILNHNLEPVKVNNVTRMKFSCSCGTHYVKSKFGAKVKATNGCVCLKCNTQIKFDQNVKVPSTHPVFIKN